MIYLVRTARGGSICIRCTRVGSSSLWPVEVLPTYKQANSRIMPTMVLETIYVCRYIVEIEFSDRVAARVGFHFNIQVVLRNRGYFTYFKIKEATR